MSPRQVLICKLYLYHLYNTNITLDCFIDNGNSVQMLNTKVFLQSPMYLNNFCPCQIKGLYWCSINQRATMTMINIYMERCLY